MTVQYTRRFRVRHYELDASGFLTDVTLVQHLQEAAIEASAALGCDTAWYLQRGTAWFVRKLTVRYLGRAVYGDEVEVGTWISGIRGVRSNREYEIHIVGSGAPLARARAEWVYVDTSTGQPTRPPEEWLKALPPIGKVEDLGVHLAGAQPKETSYRYTSRRRVRYTELDTARHVNHAVYLRWAGEAVREAVSAVGLADQARREEWTLTPAGHEIVYSAPAVEEDEVETTSWICEVSDDGYAWTHEMCHAATRKVFARVYTRMNPSATAVEALCGEPNLARR
jgi:YbgC/YbaW family acyl-CoA thioester hydrolase